MKIDMKNKKYLVTSGCSFTDGFNMAEKGSWAYYLSNMLELKLVNKARGGSGNEYISDSVIIELMNHPEIRENCVVGVAWSSFSRLMNPIYDGNHNMLDTIQPFDFIETNGEKGKYYEHRKTGEVFFRDILFCVYKTYMAIAKLNYFLDYYNIPYFYIDAMSPNKVKKINNGEYDEVQIINGYSNQSIINIGMREWPNNYKDVINDNFNSIIFKNYLNVCGYHTILEFMVTDYDRYNKGNPGHPNDVASKEIAHFIYNQII
jgi:hypothetical protein